jgi:hypothetical protein
LLHPAQAAGDFAGRAPDGLGHPRYAVGRDAETRTRGADRGDHRALGVTDRGRDGGQAVLEFVHRGRVTALPDLSEQPAEFGQGGHGPPGEALERQHQVLKDLRRWLVGQQDLAVGGGVQRDALPSPVMRRQRGRARHLVQVERVPARQDGQVDGLAHLLGQGPADRPAFLGEIQPAPGGPGQPQ